MSILANPTQKDPERAFALQKYLLLHSQHDALQKQLESISQPPLPPASASASPPMSSSPPSPARSSATHHHNQHRHRRSSSTSYATPAISPIAELPPVASTITIDNRARPSTRPTPSSRRSSSLPLRLNTSSPSSSSSAGSSANSSAHPSPHSSPSSSTSSSIADPETITASELKLINVNQQIKTTLTDLLNCESVRTDRRYMMWIQTRLMDAERELKGSRCRNRERRRSLGC